MQVSMISDGVTPKSNEDAVSVFHHSDNQIDICVVDGATSVSDQEYLGMKSTDPAWFAHTFNSRLTGLLDPEKPVEQSISQTIEILAKDYQSHCAIDNPPVYALPIAAMTFIRLKRNPDGEIALSLLGLGDCTSLSLSQDKPANLDPYENLHEELTLGKLRKMQEEGIINRAERARLIWPDIRKRRVEQNEQTNPEVLCLKPRGYFGFRKRNHILAPDSLLLVMTDGFYRLVDTYNLYTDAELLKSLSNGNLEKYLEELRSHENLMDADAGYSVKKADDASAVLCIL